MYDIMTTLCVWYTYQHRFLNELSASTTRAPTILQLRNDKKVTVILNKTSNVTNGFFQ